MGMLVRVAWIVVLVCVVAAVVAALARPLHWERTVGAAAVVGVIAASVAVYRSRQTTRS
jgi:lysylphosphatidylglycerol synthetase-like protein (DUF2156 family)